MYFSNFVDRNSFFRRRFLKTLQVSACPSLLGRGRAQGVSETRVLLEEYNKKWRLL